MHLACSDVHDPTMERLCVFCGSSFGGKHEHVAAARAVGRTLVEHHLGLVYGGGRVELMGVLADAVLEHGGEAIGVMPQQLADMDLANTGLTDLRIVGSMHERKAMMLSLSDGFLAMPGGLGTIEEIFEMSTWAQWRLHDKPCGFLNVGGYYDRIADFLAMVVSEQFMEPEHSAMIIFESDPDTLICTTGPLSTMRHRQRTEAWQFPA
jgi:uncharacterized protein (TIGR00730 family)